MYQEPSIEDPQQIEKFVQAADVAINNLEIFKKEFEKIWSQAEREKNALRAENDRLKHTLTEKEQLEKEVKEVEKRQREDNARFEAREDDTDEFIAKLQKKLQEDKSKLNEEEGKLSKQNELKDRAVNNARVLKEENDRLMEKLSALRTQMSDQKGQSESMLDSSRQRAALANKQKLEIEQEMHRINIAKMALEVENDHLKTILNDYKNYRRVGKSLEGDNEALKRAGELIKEDDEERNASTGLMIPKQNGGFEYKINLNF